MKYCKAPIFKLGKLGKLGNKTVWKKLLVNHTKQIFNNLAFFFQGKLSPGSAFNRPTSSASNDSCSAKYLHTKEDQEEEEFEEEELEDELEDDDEQRLVIEEQNSSDGRHNNNNNMLKETLLANQLHSESNRVH